MERRRIVEILNETMIMLRIGRRKYFSVRWEATPHCHISKISLWIGKYLSVGGENNYIEWKKKNRQTDRWDRQKGEKSHYNTATKLICNHTELVNWLVHVIYSEFFIESLSVCRCILWPLTRIPIHIAEWTCAIFSLPLH